MSKNTIHKKDLHTVQQGLLLHRPRVNALLKEAGKHPLISITAGAGYGKTQSVLSYLAQEKAMVIWIQLTELDNYPLRFWETITSSVEQISEDLSLKLKHLGFPDSIQSFYQFFQLLNEELYKEEKYIAVFDDCHNITGPSILNFLENLIMAISDNLHIYLLSRTDDNLPLTSLFYKGMGVRLTTEQLSFTLEETEEYFTSLGQKPDKEVLKNIYYHTEGWPFAIYLVGLRLKRGERLSPTTLRISIPTIFQMIDEEIFSKYPDKIQDLFVSLSLLDEAPPELLKLILKDMSAEMTKYARENSFINFNHHNQHYQLHNLFRDFLLEKQSRLSFDELQKTYRIAAEFYEHKNQKLDALNFYHKIKDYEKTWEIILRLNPGRFSNRTAELFMKTIDTFPDEFIKEHPMVKVIYICLINNNLETEKAYSLLLKTKEELAQKSNISQNRIAIGETCIMLAFYSMILGTLDFNVFFKEASLYLPNGSTLFSKEFLITQNDYAFTLKDGSKNEMNRYIDVMFEAMPYAEKVLNGSGFGREYIAAAEACYFTWNLNKAREYAFYGIYKAKEYEQVDLVCSGYSMLIRVSLANGNYEDAMTYKSQAREYANHYSHDSQFLLTDIIDSWFFLQIGHVDKIAPWINADEHYTGLHTPLMVSRECLIKTGYLIHLKQYREALELLETVEVIYLKRKLFFLIIHANIFKSIAYFKLGKKAESMRYLQHAYSMSHENNLIAIYVEYHRFIQEILEYAITSDEHVIPIAWLKQIHVKAATYCKRLAFVREKYERQYHSDKGVDYNLNERETEILRMLCEGYTREEIAKNFHLSINTLKYILKNIYAKLGAVNSTDAARIAIVRGIIKHK